MHRDVLTTGQVAAICHVSQQTVIRVADNGSLKGFRVPGSTHRRFMVDDVRRFMTAHNIPVEWLDEWLTTHRAPPESP
ncbi:MAG: DNA-binding response regulator MtrA [Pseudomonadota bacterium]|jgi:excisionase family DNA binding protein